MTRSVDWSQRGHVTFIIIIVVIIIIIIIIIIDVYD